MKFCPKCSRRIEYDPRYGGYDCRYCDYHEHINLAVERIKDIIEVTENIISDTQLSDANQLKGLLQLKFKEIPNFFVDIIQFINIHGNVYSMTIYYDRQVTTLCVKKTL